MTTAIVPAAFFNAEQEKLILDSFLNGASKAEAAVLMELARTRRLNPITRQIHFVKRWDSQKKREVWAAQVGIDGFRAIAERTGKYAGQDEPEFEYENDGTIKLCRVKIYRKDWDRPAVGVAHFKEYAQTTKEGGLTKMWKEKGHIMISKCSEALGLRKAFPEDTSGLYTPEEMGAEPIEERDVTPSDPVGAQYQIKSMAQAVYGNPIAYTQLIPAQTATKPDAIEAPKAEAKAVVSSVEKAKAAIKAKLGGDLKSSVTAYGQILEAAKAKGYDETTAKGFIKKWTGKGNAKDLTDDDVRIFAERMAETAQREPGSDDEEAA